MTAGTDSPGINADDSPKQCLCLYARQAARTVTLPGCHPQPDAESAAWITAWVFRAAGPYRVGIQFRRQAFGGSGYPPVRGSRRPGDCWLQPASRCTASPVRLDPRTFRRFAGLILQPDDPA